MIIDCLSVVSLLCSSSNISTRIPRMLKSLGVFPPFLKGSGKKFVLDLEFLSVPFPDGQVGAQQLQKIGSLF